MAINGNNGNGDIVKVNLRKSHYIIVSILSLLLIINTISNIMKPSSITTNLTDKQVTSMLDKVVSEREKDVASEIKSAIQTHALDTHSHPDIKEQYTSIQRQLNEMNLRLYRLEQRIPAGDQNGKS